MLDEKKSPEQVIENLYLRCLGRKPSEAEMKGYQEIVGKLENKQQALEDLGLTDKVRIE